MSGTSLDGVDLALVTFSAPAGNSGERWRWWLEAAQTVPLPPDWRQFFGGVVGEQTTVAQTLVQKDVKFGKYLGDLVRSFLVEVGGALPALVASHGHTLFHQPHPHLATGSAAQGFTFQLGHGGALAAAAGLPVVCDFRATDVALGGQAAPLVPLGDRLLFPEFAVCLNLGGIANLSVERAAGGRLAYDVCACNQLFNALAAEAGLPYDDDGRLARAGQPVPALRAALDAPAFFTELRPKSLGREWVEAHSLAVLAEFGAWPLADRLRTVIAHVAGQLAHAIRTALGAAAPAAGRQVLATGGGAFNGYLIEQLRAELAGAAEVIVPAPEIIDFKEAIIFALLGVLRWRGEVNTLASATGARRDSSGGAIYAP
ncbi:MAG: anhydro-N-acetylmuramic acid kinase [Hymenobacteraceae bacterium]|nr:anhydro-N-acetylmuramic acid kinase [Hymenobacteraceae bacterium]